MWLHNRWLASDLRSQQWSTMGSSSSLGAWVLWSRDTESALHGLRTLAIISKEVSMPTVLGTDDKEKLWSRLLGSNSGWSSIDR